MPDPNEQHPDPEQWAEHGISLPPPIEGLPVFDPDCDLCQQEAQLELGTYTPHKHAGEAPQAVIVEAPPPSEPSEPPQQVRIGGSPGVRVQTFSGGVTVQKRVTGVDPHPLASDHKYVPQAVLDEVRELLDDPTRSLTTLDYVRDLLAPWLVA